jgi:hypothetical protein
MAVTDSLSSQSECLTVYDNRVELPAAIYSTLDAAKTHPSGEVVWTEHEHGWDGRQDDAYRTQWVIGAYVVDAQPELVIVDYGTTIHDALGLRHVDPDGTVTYCECGPAIRSNLDCPMHKDGE